MRRLSLRRRVQLRMLVLRAWWLVTWDGLRAALESFPGDARPHHEPPTPAKSAKAADHARVHGLADHEHELADQLRSIQRRQRATDHPPQMTGNLSDLDGEPDYDSTRAHLPRPPPLPRELRDTKRSKPS